MKLKTPTRPSYRRSMIITVGALLCVLPVVIWNAQGDRSATWPTYAWVMFFGMPIAGVGILVFGAKASDEKIASSRFAYGIHGFILMILALPVHLLLRTVRQQKNGKRRAAR